MATIICQTCNKSNPDTLEICQFCGTPFKNRGTEPLPTIHPGEVPVKQQTSDLESTLPGWLRDMRKGDDSQSAAPTSAKPSTSAASQPVKPATPPKKEASPLDFLAGLSQINDDEEEAEPDWLASLKGNLPSDPAPAAQNQSQAPVDWMSGLTGDAPTAQPEQPVDWLSGFGDIAQSQTPQPEQPVTDWGYGNLTDEPEKSTSDWGGFNDLADEPVKPAESAPEETPDWLAALKAQDTSVNAQPQQRSEDFSFDDAPLSSGNFPDWLSNLGGESAAVSSMEPEPFASDTSSGGDDLSGWLAGMTESPVSATPAVEPKVDYSSAPGPAASDTGDFPDWLANLGSETAPAPQKLQPAPSAPVASTSLETAAAQADGDFPDWLANLGSEAAAPAPQKPEPVFSAPVPPVAAQADGDFPDWLANLGSETAAPAPQKSEPVLSAPVPPMAAQADGDFPDWLANLGGEAAPTPQKSEPAPGAPVTSMASQDPDDWSSGLSSELPVSPVAETPSNNPTSIFSNLLVNDDIGWLDTPAPEKPAQVPAEPSLPKQKAFSTGSLESLTPLRKTDDVPDWLANLNATAQKKPSEPAVLPDLPSADAFDWLSGSNAVEPPSSMTGSEPTGQPESAVERPKAAEELPSSAFLQDSSQNLDSIFSMEMPDWLSGFTPSEPVAPAQPMASEQPVALDADNLSQAELPSWVQAMRPIESVVAGTQSSADDQIVEQVGPLAGLRSVLPGQQANALGVRKPKAYSIKLQVDSVQLAQATLLENLIASEAESRPVVTAKPVVNFRPLRWMIAIVLLLVTLVPGIMNIHFFPFPDLPASSNVDAPNAEVRAFYDRVEALPDAAKVLVIFDYQPGYAGEMEQTAGPVIAHLMSKNARMAFVSTLPTGVLMSERMMDAQNKTSKFAYKKGSEYSDLGYLPGDAAGIQVFAETPDVLGNDYQNNENLWKAVTGLDRDNKLSNFDATVVLTDNPDTGRMWIEQAGPALGIKPLLMVVSAQAAPMILPYYNSQSGQVKGLVSGLAGGALYEAATQHPNGNVRFYYWDSYGMGMISAEVLIVIGGVWALLQRIRTRRAEQNQEEDEE